MRFIKIFGSFVLLVLYIFLIISPNKSYSWSCGHSLEPKELFNRHDSVFIGKVIETSIEYVDKYRPKRRVTFEVKSSIKGSIKDKITVVTIAGSEFPNGKEYLVYAYKTTEENYLYKYEEGELATDGFCSGTKEMSVAKDDLQQIAKLKKTNKTLNIIISSLVALLVIIQLINILKRRRWKKD